MKKVLAALLTGTMVISMGTSAVWAEDVDKSKTIVIYTNSGTDGRDEWLTERAAEDGFNIQVVHLGASAVTERMIAEKNNPLCDVTFGLNNIEYEKLKSEDLLEKWE